MRVTPAGVTLVVVGEPTQVVMFQGIILHWKQPAFFDYDCNMTQPLLFNILTAVENSGFLVVSIVYDMGGSNRGLLSNLSIDVQQNVFPNPADLSRNIHVFVDPPHLLKLGRNNLIDHGINTPEGMVDVGPLKELIINQSGDFRIEFKITLEHIALRGVQRQNVKKAAQLLSSSIGNAINYLGSKNQLTSTNWAVTTEFVLLIDQWIDILNSSVPYDCKKL